MGAGSFVGDPLEIKGDFPEIKKAGSSRSLLCFFRFSG
jgi:hypothetical protein